MIGSHVAELTDLARVARLDHILPIDNLSREYNIINDSMKAWGDKYE